MKSQPEIDRKILSKIVNLSEHEKKNQTIVLGGHNVFDNTISSSVVIQINASGEDLAEALEKTPEDSQKKLLDAILSVLEKRHSES